MVASGAAAVAAEVVWARMLREVFGSTVEAVSTVLAVYFGGLALGAFLAGRIAPRVPRPGRLYVALELLIALGVLATLPTIAALARHVPLWEAAVPGAGWPALRVALGAAVLLPATTAMGATYPVMVRVLGAAPEAGSVLGRLYAANTLGGVLGAAAAGFVALGVLGSRGTILVAAATNVAVAILAGLALREAGAPVPVPSAMPSPSPVVPSGGRRVLLATGVAGAGALAAEVVWTRAMVFGFGTSTYAFASILVAVLAAITVGSALYARWPPARDLERRLGAVLVVEGLAFGLSAYAFSMMDLLALHGAAIDMAAWLPRPLTWPVLWIGVALLVAGPATLVSGYAFPLAAHLRGVQLGSAARGSGQVSAVNTAATILGSLAAGFWLLPALGVGGATAAIAVTVAGVGALLLGSRPATRLAAAVAAGLLVWLVTAGALGRAQLHADIETPEDRVLFAREGPQASVRVFEQNAGGTTLRRMAIDGQTIASNAASDLLVKEVVLAHLPFLLHPAAHRVALVGLGTGITLGAIASHPEVTEMVCIEIVPEVWDAARLFAVENGDVLDDPRLHAVVGDGLQYLRGHPERFDAIVGDEKVSLHAAANGTFFSHDYYSLVRDRLRPGGVFVQWVPLILPPEDQRTVLRTFFSVFPDGVVLTLGRFGLVQVGGVPTPRLDRERAAAVLGNEAIRRALTFPTFDLGDPAVLAAAAVGGASDLAAMIGPGPVQTADRPVLDYGIARWDFRFETYRARAAGTLAAFGELLGRVPSPWADPATPPEEAARARRALAALLDAHQSELRGDAAGVLAALTRVDGPEGLPALRPLADRYRALLGVGGGSSGPG